MSIVGVDIGGTFTDLVAFRDGTIVIGKTSTTPADPTQGVATSLRETDCDIPGVREFLHGSTIAINTVLESKGAPTALLTTRGFRDVYAIGRGNRPEGFNVFFHRPRPLIPRDRCHEVNERIDARGEIVTPLDENEIMRLGRMLDGEGVQSIAVCFLHSYANPRHEEAAGRILREAFPHIFVTLSHEILREVREYERTSTTALSAYVGPRVRNYLGRLEGFLGTEAFGGQIHIMRSNGGTMSLAQASAQPVWMMESGPVAGMIGAGHLARLLGFGRSIGFDMGGTTAKSALLTDGVPMIENGYYIGGYAQGQPMQLPVVDIVEVGAGGGSIAWCDAVGSVHVGPQSAGAEPGPACYGKGGDDPAVTDADLLLGRLNAGRFLGGEMRLQPALSETTLKRRIADPLGLSVREAALGVVRIADSAMALAVRGVSVNKGVDPRNASMIAFGGAGPLHALAIAKEIFIPTVVIPKLPGNFSAFGMLLAPWRQDLVRTLVGQLGELDVAQVRAAYDELFAAGRRQLIKDRLSLENAVFSFAADLRYVGQEHAITVPVSSADMLAANDPELRLRFDALHDERYGHAASDQRIQVINLRLVVTVPRQDGELLGFIESAYVPSDPRPVETRPVIFDNPEAPLPARVFWRPGLPTGFTVEGPAVIEERNSTTLIFPGDIAEVTPHGHLVVHVKLDLPPEHGA